MKNTHRRALAMTNTGVPHSILKPVAVRERPCTVPLPETNGAPPSLLCPAITAPESLSIAPNPDKTLLLRGIMP